MLTTFPHPGTAHVFPQTLVQGFRARRLCIRSDLQPTALQGRACTSGAVGCAHTSLQWRRSSVRVACSAAGSAALPAEGGNNPAAEYSELAAKIRGFLFYLWTFTLAVPLFVVMMVQAPFVALLDKHRRLAQHFVNDIWAKVSTWPFYRVHIEGAENLPAPDQPAVYVANHQSFLVRSFPSDSYPTTLITKMIELDIYTLFHLSRPFKFISKTSNFLIPIVGWSMFMTGHVRLNRVDRKSQLACLTSCRKLLQQGASVLFFPEGTRATDMRLQDFKKGAFSVAAKAGVPVVPITLVGTGRKMPNRQESKVFPGNVEVVVHPQVPPASADKMMEESRAAILSGLPPEMRPLGP